MNKQREVLKILAKTEQATLKEIYEQIPFSYYANGMKHLGAILSRMVKNGSVVRIKRGVFRAKMKDIQT